MRCRPVIVGSVVAVAAFSLLAAGCGSPPTGRVANLDTTTTTTASAGAGGSAAPGGELAQYAGCMRSHGFSNFPDSFGSSTAIRAAKGQINQISTAEASSPRFQAAQRACATYAPQTEPTRRVAPGEIQKLLAVSRCMRAHGVPTFPDPNPTTGDYATPAGIDKNSPEVLAALRACGSLGQAAGLVVPNTGP
jgi:hypothetical protein